ncbi:hypothetical protein [Salipiger abyssi]|uniref:Uncharacterized protein n=1 Tax=Salipiger abyssi TaxID=1250539 RepID=A0A1P8UWF6_9RHOB|nr:hypothetical protein [Salipiger abyssi]APZ53725.1 hypothetical protein Ga0080574_TMP3391 [Salipiger abyssi]
MDAHSGLAQRYQAQMGIAAQPGCALEAHPESALTAAACRSLWASVLLTAWRDSFGEGRERHGEFTSTRLRRNACDWFGSRDFAEVCFLAGLDARAVLDRWRRLQAERGERHV